MEKNGLQQATTAVSPCKLPGSNLIGGHVGPKICLDNLEKGKIPCPCPDFNPGSSNPQPSITLQAIVHHNQLSHPPATANPLFYTTSCTAIRLLESFNPYTILFFLFYQFILNTRTSSDFRSILRILDYRTQPSF